MQPARRLDRNLAIAPTLLALMLGLGGPAWAAPTVARGDGSHDCACGMGCRGSCCCEVHRPTRTPERPRRERSGPCLASAPCGVPGAPAPSPSFGREKTAPGAVVAAPPAPRPGACLRIPPPESHASAISEPPDEPPEPARPA